MTGGIPLLVDLAGRRVVVVGAGPVAAAKTAPLLEAGADVVVVAPEAVAAIRTAADSGGLTWLPRGYADGDLAGAFLAVAATADPAVNARVGADAAARATFFVRAGRVGEQSTAPGTAALLGTVRRGDLLLAVSTGGRAPAAARHIRVELEAAFGPEYGDLVALLADLRDDAGARRCLDGLDGAARRAAWRSLPMADIVDLLRNGDVPSARELALACLCSSSD